MRGGEFLQRSEAAAAAANPETINSRKVKCPSRAGLASANIQFTRYIIRMYH